MNLPFEIFGDVIVVHAPQELGVDQSEGLESLLVTLDRKQLVLDLDSTEAFDSRGLTSLLNSQEALRELGGDLKISTANLSNLKILEITRLDQQLDVFESVLDAVRSFQ